MKKTLNVGIGGSSFIIDEDAYRKLNEYLEKFRSDMNVREASEVMEDVEQRIAEIFQESLQTSNRVVDMALVNKIIDRLGLPDTEDGAPSQSGHAPQNAQPPRKRLYRDEDNVVLGGVCSGLAAYFNIDIALVRVLFVIALVFFSFGFWIYVIMWIAVPMARTATEKIEMRGLPVTADNLRQYSGKKR